MLEDLRKYNEQTRCRLSAKYDNLQMGFFNGNDVLFIGQNPGQPVSTTDVQQTQVVVQATTWLESEEKYVRMIQSSKVGKYLSPIISEDWRRVSFTNVVKVPTLHNHVPTRELFAEFYPILLKQVTALEPKLIVCLGKYAGSTLGVFEMHSSVQYDSFTIVLAQHHSTVTKRGANAIKHEQDWLHDFILKQQHVFTE